MCQFENCTHSLTYTLMLLNEEFISCTCGITMYCMHVNVHVCIYINMYVGLYIYEHT